MRTRSKASECVALEDQLALGFRMIQNAYNSKAFGKVKKMTRIQRHNEGVLYE